MLPPSQEEPLAVARARALMSACHAAELPAKLLGGLAIYMLSPATHTAPFQRQYNDVDVAIQNRRTSDLKNVMVQVLGMTPDRMFNASHGDRRQLYRWDDGMEVDVFVDVFEQCQQLDLRPWLTRSEAPTLPRAVLLLTKLQIVQINTKDILDAAALVMDYPDIFEDKEMRDILSHSWPWYTVVSDNIATMRSRIPDLLAPDQAATISRSLDRAAQHLERLPKSIRWKARAALGKRVPWYELPEDK